MTVSFGDSIRRGREVAGLSQARVAELIGKSPSTVRSWELGRTSPSEATAVSALAAVLGLDEPTLLSRAGFEVEEAPSRLTLEQELLALRIADPTPIPPPEPGAQTKPNAVARIRALLPKPMLPTPLRETPRHLGPERADRPPPPAASLAVDKLETPAASEISLQVTTPTSRDVKVTVVPRPAMTTARSYIEDTEQREFYRWRTIVTIVGLFLLFLAFWWALRNLGGAVSDFFGGFIDQLNF